MRSLDLAKAATAAEKLRLTTMVKRQLHRTMYGGIAVVCLLGAIVWLSVAAYLTLAWLLGPLWAALCLLAVNLILFGVFAFLVARSKASAIEIEAAELRDDAIAEAQRQMALGTLVGPVGRLAGRSAFRLARAAIKAPFRATNHYASLENSP